MNFFMNEGTVDDLTSWVKTKLHGYDAGHIDTLADRLENLKTEVEKENIIKEVDEALRKLKADLPKEKDPEKKKQMLVEIEVYNKIRSRASSFDVTDRAKPVDNVKHIKLG